ncbi:MAG: hypothetical protein AB1791_21750, partial [Chloroflexota bacterium]
VTGYTHSGLNFPFTEGAFDTTPNDLDIFITKLNPTGTSLMYSTFLGESGTDYAYGIAVGLDGSAYVAGQIFGADFPTTLGAYDTSFNGQWDVFMSRLDPTGSALEYSTFLGTASLDYGMAIAIGPDGTAYVTGYTDAGDFPTTDGAYDGSYGGGLFDAFVSRLNPDLPSPTPTPLPTATPTATPLPTNTPTPTPTSTSTPTPTATPPSPTDLIFADGFESGDLLAWSAASIDGGDLSVSASAALVGAFGMQAVLDDNRSIFVLDSTPSAEPRYRVRFYFDPNGVAMANGNWHDLCQGYLGVATQVVRIQFGFFAGDYLTRASLLDDSSIWHHTPWFILSDSTHFIEFDWRAATAVGANDGGLTLWLDGVQQWDISNLDNDTRRIDSVRWGAVAGVDSGTRGTYYFDAFESRRQTYIGP